MPACRPRDDEEASESAYDVTDLTRHVSAHTTQHVPVSAYLISLAERGGREGVEGEHDVAHDAVNDEPPPGVSGRERDGRLRNSAS